MSISRAKKPKKPKWSVTPEVIAKAKEMSENLLTQEQMCQYFQISVPTWYKYLKLHPELASVVNKGKSATINLAAGKLIQLVKEGNITAIIFLLKTQGKWREAEKDDKTKEDAKSTTIELSINTKDPVEASKIYQRIMAGN